MDTDSLQASDRPNRPGLAPDEQIRRTQAYAGIAERPERLMVRVSGGDRVAFMHGMCSNDIRGLATGAITYALLLTEHAHVIADFNVWAAADALWLELDQQLWPAARTHLERFLVADDVELEERPELGLLELAGPRTETVLAFLSAGELSPWRFVEPRQASAGRLLGRIPRLGMDGFTLVLDRAAAFGIKTDLMAANPELVEIGPAAREILRVEHGIARVGIDVGEKTLALEARLHNAISYRKGCYVGQETIERATARGGVKRRLMGLRFAPGDIPATGAPVWLGGKDVGRLTSIALSPRLGLIGLAMLHQSAWQVGEAVEVGESRFKATVSELPL